MYSGNCVDLSMNSTIFIQFKSIASYFKSNLGVNVAALTSILFLAACGGGEEGGTEYISLPSYGAIAINKSTGRAAITADYSSQRTANREAEELCGVGCVTVLEFGPYLCGALARADTLPIFGWASNLSRSDAKSKAIDQCVKAGGNGCQVVLDKCNTS